MNYYLLGLTFLSVNLDFFFILLFLLRRYRLDKVIIGYLLGTIILLTLSFGVGKALASFLPEWLLGALGFLPIYMALKDDDDDTQQQTKHAPITNVLLTYLSVCAGCNLAIFLPVLAGETAPHFLMTLLFIGSLTIMVTVLIKFVADLPPVTRFMDHFGEPLMKICYILIGLYVFWDSGLISHVIGLF